MALDLCSDEFRKPFYRNWGWKSHDKAVFTKVMPFWVCGLPRPDCGEPNIFSTAQTQFFAFVFLLFLFKKINQVLD
jgi:hypothetical protein